MHPEIFLPFLGRKLEHEPWPSCARDERSAATVTWIWSTWLPLTPSALCDEGLAMDRRRGNLLAAAPDGHLAEDDFGPGTPPCWVSDCFIPARSFIRPHSANRTDMVGDTPRQICRRFSTPKALPGPSAHWKSRPINQHGMGRCFGDGVAKDEVLNFWHPRRSREGFWPSSTPSGRRNLVRSAGADTHSCWPMRSPHGKSTYKRPSVQRHRRAGQPVAMLWDAQVFDLDGWIIPAGLPDDRVCPRPKTL